MIAPSEILQAQYVLAFPDPILTLVELGMFRNEFCGSDYC